MYWGERMDNVDFKKWLKSQGVTQTKLAAELGVSKQMVNNQLNAPLTLRVMNKYANVVGYECEIWLNKVDEGSERERLLKQIEELNAKVSELEGEKKALEKSLETITNALKG